jgi:hypothetical protein
MVRIQTLVTIHRLTPPQQVVRLPEGHFTRDEQDRIRMSVGMCLLLNTSVGWWRFLFTEAEGGMFTFESSGRPGEHVAEQFGQ